MWVKTISATTPAAQKTIVGTSEPPSPLSAPATIWLEAKKIAPSMIPAERLPAAISSRSGAPAHWLYCSKITPATAIAMIPPTPYAATPATSAQNVWLGPVKTGMTT